MAAVLRKDLSLFFFFQLGFTHPGPKTNEVELHFKEQWIFWPYYLVPDVITYYNRGKPSQRLHYKDVGSTIKHIIQLKQAVYVIDDHLIKYTDINKNLWNNFHEVSIQSVCGDSKYT